MSQLGAPSAALERVTQSPEKTVQNRWNISIAHLVVRRHDDDDCVQGLGASAQHLPDGVIVSAEVHDLNLHATKLCAKNATILLLVGRELFALLYAEVQRGPWSTLYNLAQAGSSE